MAWNGAKKIFLFLLASTLLSSLFSGFMIYLSMKIDKDVSFLRRKLSNSGDNTIRFQKYRQP
ncbi:hypothetical protein [Bacillus sp. MB2021]|uniref:hypothetical protein n=1 Tax=Bacillus sp. MB2021 TaxID=1408303 RepID=UPI0004E0B796|nr:hypothetical protein [Bacillus sp. MB2021]